MTIFGYSAPRTDQAAIDLMKEGWGLAKDRSFEEIEIIDIKDRVVLEETWSPFIHTHHWGAHPSLYESYFLMRWPRRTCESFFNANMQNDPDPDNTMPADADWDGLRKFVEPLVEAERKETLSE